MSPESPNGSPGRLADAEAARQAAAGEKVSFHRLSREEYRNTIRDLLGVTYDATDPTGLPEDPDWQGSSGSARCSRLSPTHVEKYLAAAETVLNEALALGPRAEGRGHPLWTAASLRVPGDVAEELAAPGTSRQSARRHRAQQRWRSTPAI